MMFFQNRAGCIVQSSIEDNLSRFFTGIVNGEVAHVRSRGQLQEQDRRDERNEEMQAREHGVRRRPR